MRQNRNSQYKIDSVTCNTVVLYTRLIWAGLPLLLQAH